MHIAFKVKNWKEFDKISLVPLNIQNILFWILRKTTELVLTLLWWAPPSDTTSWPGLRWNYLIKLIMVSTTSNHNTDSPTLPAPGITIILAQSHKSNFHIPALISCTVTLGQLRQVIYNQIFSDSNTELNYENNLDLWHAIKTNNYSW